MKSKPVKALYDRIGGRYHQNKSLAISDYTELPVTLALAGDVEGKRVLDAGCGPGRHSQKLTAVGAHVIGINISEEMVRIARENCGNRAEFYQADFERVEFEPESFDLIIASLSLMYAKDLDPIFSELLPLVKAGRASHIFNLSSHQILSENSGL